MLLGSGAVPSYPPTFMPVAVYISVVPSGNLPTPLIPDGLAMENVSPFMQLISSGRGSQMPLSSVA